jgi:hypothetical protein
MRLPQIVLIVSFIAFSWLAMQGVHETGHLLAAWATGGHVQKVVLHPLALSRTDVGPNPHPLAVVGAGAIWGSALPVLGWALVRRWRGPGLFLWRFFAGFCLVANGAYLVAGSFVGETDSSRLIQLGTSQAVVIVVGGVAAACGLMLWHRQGEHFGFGVSKGRVQSGAVVASVLLLAALAIGEFIWGSR